MEKKEVENYIKAGKILQEVQKKAKKTIKPGQKLLEIALEIEKHIETLGGKPAFPANLSRNNEAAHYSPSSDDKLVLKESDVMKVDLGVHVEGYIADASFTLNFSNEHSKMIEASEKALENALSKIKVGAKLSDIGKEIETTIKKAGFNPIQNLSGHGLGKFQCHTIPTIPNYETRDERILEDGMAIAIEPFATDGKGFVKEAPQSEIFGLNEPKNVRNMQARKILEFILDEYDTLPFAERWISNKMKMSEFQRKVAMRELISKNCIKAFPILREQPDKIVTQAETSVILHDGKVIITV
ncbi:MAG: type II methionyl aminopeptidase [Candidatus Diapherotrites archaeon]